MKSQRGPPRNSRGPLVGEGLWGAPLNATKIMTMSTCFKTLCLRSWSLKDFEAIIWAESRLCPELHDLSSAGFSLLLKYLGQKIVCACVSLHS